MRYTDRASFAYESTITCSHIFLLLSVLFSFCFAAGCRKSPATQASQSLPAADTNPAAAIDSRFPLRNARVVRFENQGHDWYTDEKKGVSKLEKGKQKGAGAVFGEKILREVRRGNRMMLLADIESAQIPGGALTVVATHLEAKSKPDDRRKQLEEILTQVKTVDHPVVIAGDMNTSGTDSVPTSFEREVKKRLGSSSFWVQKGIKYATGNTIPR